MSLRDLQESARAWRAHNFPGTTAEQQLFGMVEEMGELAHAFLKHSQEIRGVTADVAYVKMKDAIGDWIIFATGFADAVGIDLEHAVTDTWNEVRIRDWVAYPENGVDK